MKCPKCGYFGPDSLNICKKCGKDLFAEKAKLGLSTSTTRSFKPRPIPQEQQAPPHPIPEAPISVYRLQEKTSPFFTNEPPELLIAPHFMKPEIKKQDTPPSEPFEVRFEDQEKGSGESLKKAFPREIKNEDILPPATGGEEAQGVKISPHDLEDFEFPEDLTEVPPPLSALSSKEGLYLPDEQEQKEVNGLSIDDGSEKDGITEENKELLSSEEREKILRMKNPLLDHSLEETFPERIQTEPIDNEEIAQILEDIKDGPSEPDTTT